MLLQKYIAQSGYCSRRKAEELIKQGRVTLNGKIAKIGDKVNKGDQVIIQGKKIKLPKEQIYIILNKPKGYVCTSRKFKKEKNVFDLLPIKEKLSLAGRLDKDSRGLVLLSNDGDLIQKLTHPRYEHEKEYIVKIKNEQNLSQSIIMEKFIKGIDIGEGDGIVSAKKIKFLGNNKFRIILTSGKKRQIRRMFKALNCKVLDLERIRIGNIKLGKLKKGEWKKIKKPI